MKIEVLEQFVLTVAPELAQLPFYVTEQPAAHPDRGTSCLAFTAGPGRPAFDIRADLIAQGRWQGIGPTIVICPAGLELAEDELLAIVAHETAHCLPWQAPAEDREPHPMEVELELREIRENIATEPPLAPRWEGGHELQFIRRCCHINARGWRAGFEVSAAAMHFAGKNYELSPWWRYARELADEVEQMSGATFSEIDAAPNPPGLLELWRSDVAKWYQQNPTYFLRKETNDSN